MVLFREAPTNDRNITELIAAASLKTVPDVVALLRALDGELANDDGLKWFNLLYLSVTEGVEEKSAAVQWQNPKWLERLDVTFAKLYLAALAAELGKNGSVARCWVPLLESRNKQNIMRVQFAFAGINAHINHDLSIALVQTGRQLRVPLRRGTPEHRDFEKVNSILDAVQEQAKQFIATGIAGMIDQDLGMLDDRVANFKVRKARETAWANGEILWRLNRVPALRDDFLTNLDRLVALAGRGLLVPLDKVLTGSSV
ncbi:MAG: DUF5995 family protein [Candidatus Binatia bacterium]